ncbi:glycosyltransferase family 4 protein [Pedobacter nototheniae]|uniref:glycosyltransferase family 4 protein n=1 Tax=Pedobacter nototheniae TaxID=2488994 RepID=UPI0029312270|nr:glycosyltransferase family 4 protein [Pedobacter nototheniae]
MKNKNVLFLTLHTFGLTGGIEQVCRTFSKTLSDLNIEQKIRSFTVLSMYDNQPDLNYIPQSAFKGYHGKQVAFGLASIKQGLKADILILSHVHLLTFARILKKLKPSLRIILFVHGIEVWNTLERWKRQLLNKIEIWAVSHYTASRLTEVNKIEPNHIKILNNCLDPYFLWPKEITKSALLLERYGINPNQKVLLTICRLASSEQYKGYDLIINCLKEIVKVYPDLIYLLVGKADAPEQERIDKLIEKCGLEKNVTCTGYIKDAELGLHYQLADVFIMPSKAEGFGLVFIEAAAYGCAVIAGNKDGSTDALLNGQLGELIDPEDATAIYQSTLHALNHPLEAESRLKQQYAVFNTFGYHNYTQKVSNLLGA